MSNGVEIREGYDNGKARAKARSAIKRNEVELYHNH